MRERMKKAGWIGLGAVLGILLSLNLSVFAQREPKLPIPYEDLQLLSAVFGKIKSDYVEQVPDDKLIREAINGMVHGLDPHSDFLDAEAYKELQVDTQGRFGGLGIEVGVEDGIVRVISPIEDTPAFKAGIKSGDLIVKIDDLATRGIPLSKAVEKMRGKPGTPVVLTIVRKDVDTPLTFTLLRQEINVKSVKAKILEPGYGYLRVRKFQEDTGADLAKGIREIYRNGDLKGLVLDLRSDPGGLLNQAVAVSAAFLPKDALVVYTDGRSPDARMRLTATRENYIRRGDDYFRDLPAGIKTVPMVVLVDAGTASASEIVAGALQDHHRATVLGAQTFGKGSVQTILPLGNSTGLKLTTARYYTPAGRSIQAKGIEPDLYVDDGRDSPNRIREANLERHLVVPIGGAKGDAALDTKVPVAPGNTAPPDAKVDPKGGAAVKDGATPAPANPAGPQVEAPLPRVDFGSDDDFQLKQAMNHLKGAPVIAKAKATTAQAKPQ